MKRIAHVVFLSLLSVWSVSALAKVPICKNPVPAAEREDYRNAKVEAVAGRGTLFNNAEGLLPGAAANQVYREYDLGRDQAGGRGAHRLVMLVQGGSKNVILDQYYTPTHYQSFCQLQN